MDTVTPSIGNTQGVRLSSNPPTNSERNHTMPPRASAPSRRLCAVPPPFVLGVTAPDPAGAPVAAPLGAVPGLAPGAPLAGVAGVAAAAVTRTGTVNATTAGARQTWSLHAWK